MKVFVEHDKHGTIRAVLVRSSEDAPLALGARPGHSVTEVDASHVRDGSDLVGLARLRMDYVVDVKGKLVRKP